MGVAFAFTLELSEHARRRMRQRGISAAAVTAVLQFGQAFHADDGCLAYLVTKRVVSAACERGLRLEPFSDIAVIEDPEGRIVTAQHVRHLPRSWEVAR